MLPLSFIALTLLVNLLLIRIGFQALRTEERSLKWRLVIALVLWQVLIYLIADSRLLMSPDFPPRFALAFIFPSFFFIGFFLYSNRNREWLHRIPRSWPVYFQSFRIVVETLFIHALAEGVFNPQVTLEGYNYDMLFALTALPIGYAVYQKRWLPERVIVLWNYLGLAVLASVIFLFMASLYKPQVFGSESPLLPLEAMSYPYVLIAGFLMPSAVFLHMLSLVQFRKRK